jgi:NOL1/NOP2/sun family putative RNA methylase
MNLPPPLLRDLSESNGCDTTAFLLAHATPPPVSVRQNSAKPTSQFDACEAVAWCTSGRYLPQRPIFTLDPLFQAGTYYVQEASSMFLHHALSTLLDPNEHYRVLDLCAAPGGKSTLIANWLSADSLLVANEVIKSRANVLADNLSRWGTLNAVVTNNDPADFGRVGGYFDVMVIDAPCSGSGLFRKEPEAIAEWSEQAVKLCVQRQQRILADAWEALAEDGILLYSTCSYSVAENEGMADWICQTFGVESLSLDVPNEWGIQATRSPKHQAQGYRFYPHCLRGEGFFMAAFRKTEGSYHRQRSFKQERTKSFKQEKAILSQWVSNVEDLVWTEKNGEYYALNPLHYDDFQLLQKNFYLRKAGVRLGKLSPRELIPDHDLALSQLPINQAVQRLDLPLELAIRYLRKDELQPDDLPHTYLGWVLMCYQGKGLGWAKILPNRLNNYYPKEWRILMEG